MTDTTDLRERDARAQARMDEIAARAHDWGRENQQLGGMCDFCCWPLDLATVVTYTTAGAIDATIEGITADLGVAAATIAYSPEWAACPSCDPVVAAGDPQALADHAIEHRNTDRTGPIRDVEQTRRDLVEVYTTFYDLKPVRTEGAPALLRR